MTHLQSFCLGKSLQEVKDVLENKPYFIKIKEKESLILFFYDQIHSDFSILLVQDCRGIILEKETYKIVCWPFSKFFNYGEKNAVQIDWSSAEVQEKMDGSIMKLYYYNQKWNVASNSCIEALSDFKSWFDQCLEMYPQFSYNCNLNPRNTYIFEMIHPDNRIVVLYNEKRLVHLGTRDNTTGQEYQAGMYPFDHPKIFQLKSLDLKQPTLSFTYTTIFLTGYFHLPD